MPFSIPNLMGGKEIITINIRHPQTFASTSFCRRTSAELLNSHSPSKYRRGSARAFTPMMRFSSVERAVCSVNFFGRSVGTPYKRDLANESTDE